MSGGDDAARAESIDAPRPDPTVAPAPDAGPGQGPPMRPLGGDGSMTPAGPDAPPAGPDAAASEHDSKGGPGKHIKRTAYVLIFAFIVDHLVVPQLGGARKAVHLLSQVNPALLVLALALEIGAFMAYTQFTRATLPPDAPIDWLTLFRIQLATKSVTNLVPGGSAAGGTLGYRLLTEGGVEPSDAGFALASVGLGSAVVLNFVLWIALLVSIPLNGFDPIYVSAAIVGVILLGAFGGLIVLLMRGRDQAERVIRAIARPIPFVNQDAAARVVRQIAGRLREIAADPALIRRSILWAMANWVLDASSLWVFIRAFGRTVGPVELIVAFGLANVLAAIPITPGGLGVVEAVLTSTLVGFGLDRGTAAISVVTYRLAAFWLPIPLGALAYGSLKVGPRRLRDRSDRHPIRRLTADTLDVAEVRKWDIDHPS